MKYVIAALLVVSVVSGASYEHAMRKRAARQFPAPGRLVDVGGGRRIQLDCRGSGSPTVVLESGLDTFGSLAWAAVHDSVASTTRVCAYSRAGIMWSDPGTRPFDAKAAARDLHRALVTSGESPQWVMVGHSLGGPYVLSFTKLYDDEVAGFVFIDATHPEQFTHFREVTRKALMPTSGIVRFGGAMAWSGLVRLLPAPRAPSTWPSEIDRVPPAFLPTSLAELGREIDAIPATLADAGTVRSLGNRPLVVLTAGREQSVEQLHALDLTAAQGARLHAVSLALHADQARWSRRGRHEVVEDASHYIQFDQPAVVIAAIRDVVRETRLRQ